MTKAEELKLFQLIATGTEKEANEARAKIVQANKGLVTSCAKQYWKSWRQIDYVDLEQVGYVGLMKAINTFDDSKGCKFSTYAYKCIYRLMHAHIAVSGTVKDWHNLARNVRDMVMPKVHSLDKELMLIDEEHPETYYNITPDPKGDSQLQQYVAQDYYMQLIASLKSHERQLINWVYQDRLTCDQIGARLKLTRQGVNVRLQKIYKKLRKAA